MTKLLSHLNPRRSHVLLAMTVSWLCFAAGCLSPQQKEWTCERAQAAYAAYQTAEASGLVMDPRVVASARLAGAFLAAYCGWNTTGSRSVAPGAAQSAPAVDKNGVLILDPPSP